jgi:hypothetical protein
MPANSKENNRILLIAVSLKPLPGLVNIPTERKNRTNPINNISKAILPD